MESAGHGGLSYIQPLTVSPTIEFTTENETVSCVHFWRIASPNGPFSLGTCKLCGNKKEFKNSLYGSTTQKS